METTIKAGRYWVGDPCYYISDDNWNSVCDQIFGGLEPNQPSRDIDGMFINADGKEFIVIGTRYGDGCYSLIDCEKGCVASLGVDAGLLSIIPVSKDAPLGESMDGFVIELKEDVEFSGNDGDFTFGNYSVNTSGDDEWDDGWGDDEEEEEI